MADPHPATTVMLLRDTAEGIGVFLVQRHRKSGFLPMAWVFPGGRVDGGDALAGHPRVLGGTALLDRVGLPRDTGVGYAIAGVRETFEEAGIWLGTGVLPEEEREPLARGSRTLVELLDAHDAGIDLDRLHPWSWWVTPTFEPKRFDTRFFAARAEGGGRHDHHETVDSGWFTPAEVLAGAQDGRFPMAPPTWWTISELASYSTVDAVLAAAWERPQRPIEPLLDASEHGFCLLLPGHGRHPEPAIPGLPSRVRFEAGSWVADDVTPSP